MNHRRLALVASSLLIAACGLDVVGTATPDAGSTPDASSPDRDAAVVDPPDGVTPDVVDADAEVDAGPVRETVASDIDSIFTIAIAQNVVLVGTPAAVRRVSLAVPPLLLGPIPLTNVHSLVVYDALAVFAYESAGGLMNVPAGDGESNTGNHGAARDVVGTRPPDGQRLLVAFDQEVHAFGPDAGYMPDVKLTTNSGGGPVSITAAGDDVFWADVKTGKIMHAVVSGNPAAADLYPVEKPTSVLVDGNALLFTSSSDISRAPLVAGIPIALATGLGHPISLAIDGDYVYWLETDSGSLQRVDRMHGGTAQTLATGSKIDGTTYAHLIAFAGDYVYWGQPKDKAVYRIRK